MSDSWQQVVVEKDPSTMKPADVANLGPAPRDLMPAHQAYVKKAKPSFAGLWLAIAILSAGSYAMFLAFSGPFEIGKLAHSWFALGAIGIAVWTGRGAARRRAVVRKVIREGELRFARLLENRQTQINRSSVYKKFRYDAVFDVDGRRVVHSTLNDGMSMINKGQLVEVVYTPEVPDEVVPTFLLV